MLAETIPQFSGFYGLFTLEKFFCLGNYLLIIFLLFFFFLFFKMMHIIPERHMLWDCIQFRNTFRFYLPWKFFFTVEQQEKEWLLWKVIPIFYLLSVYKKYWVYKEFSSPKGTKYYSYNCYTSHQAPTSSQTNKWRWEGHKASLF